jgi:hypothetical protein
MFARPKGSNRVGVSLPSPEDGNGRSFQNCLFSSYLDVQTMDHVHKPNDSVTPFLSFLFSRRQFTTLLISTIYIMQSQIAGLVNDELEMISKEMTVA